MAGNDSTSAGFDPLHRDDAVGAFKACSERFGELAALFGAIAKERDIATVKRLCSLGEDVADDFENTADIWREQLAKAGFRQEA